MAAGYVAQNMSWEWCFYFPAIFLAATTIIIFFGLDESMYDRDLLARQAAIRGSTSAHISSQETSQAVVDEKHPAIDDTDSNSETTQLVYETQSYWQSRKLFTLVPGKPNRIMHHVIGPLKHLYNFPIMSMSGFQYGAYLMLFTVLNGTWAAIFEAPPYNFSSGIGGVLYIFPFIGQLLASQYCGKFADWFHNRAARRNKGVREPEQRLWLYLACTILTPTGLLLYGVGGAHGIHWFGVGVGAAMVTFGGTVAGTAPIGYISDSYKEVTFHLPICSPLVGLTEFS